MCHAKAWRVALPCLTLLPGMAWAAAAAEQASARSRPARLREAWIGKGTAVIVRLDDTGIADWGFLNRRRPPDLFGALRAGMRDLLEGRLPPAAGASGEECRAREEKQLQADMLCPDGFPCRAMFNCLLPMDNVPQEYRCTRKYQTPCLKLLQQAVFPHGGPFTVQFVNRSSTRDFVVTLDVPQGPAGSCPPQKGEDASTSGQRSPRQQPPGQPPPGQPPARTFEARVSRNWKLVPNAGQPLCRQQILVPARGGVAGIYVLDLVRIMVGEPTPGQPPNSGKPPKAPVTFDVAFFSEDAAPAHAHGSFTLVEELDEPPSAFALSTVLKAGWTVEPTLSLEPAARYATEPLQPHIYSGRRLDHFPATGRFEVTQTLGDRADGEVAVTFKDGDLGGAATRVEAGKFKLNVYSTGGVVLSAGRFTLAEPTSGIALNEAGDGFRVGWRSVSLAHLVKRESVGATADPENQDNHAWIVQVENLGLTGAAGLGLFKATFLYGNERGLKTPQKPGDDELVLPHQYFTLGGDVGFGFRGPQLSGSLGIYRSWRRSRGAGLPDASGTSGLLTLSRSWVTPQTENNELTVDKELTVKRDLSLQIGYGSGDDPRTPRDEGYLGETAGFAPDALFLARIATQRRPIKAGSSSDPTPLDQRLTVGTFQPLAGGLSNKHYAALTYTDRTFSPLRWVARLVRLDLSADIESEATRIAFHHYRFNEPVNASRDAGSELDVTFELEAPKAVRTTLAFAWFLRGAALKPGLPTRPWSISASLTIPLK